MRAIILVLSVYVNFIYVFFYNLLLFFYTNLLFLSIIFQQWINRGQSLRL